MRIDLAVVDAAEVIRVGIREIVSSADTIQLVGEWSNVQDFYESLEESSVEVLLLGDNATSSSLKQTTQKLLQQQPKLRIIVLAASFTTELIDDLASQGVVGFICKDEEICPFMIGAINAAKRGDTYISPKTARTLFLSGNGHNGVSFSPKQLQVLHYMAEYLTPQEIARKMEVSVSSIYNLQQRMRIELGVKTSGQILIEATKIGLIGGRE